MCTFINNIALDLGFFGDWAKQRIFKLPLALCMQAVYIDGQAL